MIKTLCLVYNEKKVEINENTKRAPERVNKRYKWMNILYMVEIETQL